MHERAELALKVACAVLGAMLFYQVVRMLAHGNPLGGVSIPALPTLAAPTNAAEKSANPMAMQVSTKPATNIDSTSGVEGTNAAKRVAAAKVDTNASANANPAPPSPIQTVVTNRVAAGTNDSRSTNAVLTTEVAKGGTNSGSDVRKAGTNVVAGGESGKTGTVARVENTAGKRGSGSARVGPESAKVMAGRPKKTAEMAPAMQARVDKITDSEILAPVIHPLPMALLGIAGNVAFLRSPNGRTEMVKVGDEMGGLKLLRIGTNRVLVLHEGEKKELTIFSGMGGDSLMSKDEKGTTK